MTRTPDAPPCVPAFPPAGRTPLARSLGLSGDEAGLMGRLFGELTASLGIDGGPIFGRLLRGHSIGEALAVPDAVVERIYGRAHRWFALGRVDKATPLFRALCLLRDEDADFWLGYGICLRYDGRLAEAGRAFQSAANLRPGWALPWFHALELALFTRQWQLAQAALSAYDDRAGKDTPPAVADEAARLRMVLDHALAGALPAGPPLTDPSCVDLPSACPPPARDSRQNGP